MKSPARLLGGKAYESAELCEELNERGTKPVIPNRSDKKQLFRFNEHLYKLLGRIESALNRLKDFRVMQHITQARAELLGFCLPRRSPCMEDLMSLDSNPFHYAAAGSKFNKNPHNLQKDHGSPRIDVDPRHCGRISSLSAAARRLDMPLATVSRKVSDLEAHLKTRLLIRSSRKLALTEAGQSYVAACKRILEDMGEAERAVSGNIPRRKANWP